MKFRKYIQITSVLTAFFALVFIKNALGGSEDVGTVIAPAQQSEASPAGLPNPTIVASLPTSTPAPLATNNPVTPTPRVSQYKDGTFTGSVADAFYGNVQIQVVVTGGKIAQVTFLQYPSDQRTSQYINSQAMPLLQSEAIAAQSEHVSGVSGASATSGAFEKSLASALQQARA